MTMENLTIIGERINPGFKSTKELFENEDIQAIQALAVKQRDAGAAYLNVNIGLRAKDDPKFMSRIIRAIQEVVDIPLSFDFPNLEVQVNCLETYDQDKAGGMKPIINSISEPRQEMMELLKVRPCRVVIMSSERMENGSPKPNKTGAEMAATAKRLANALLDGGQGMTPDDLFVDVAIGTLSSDMEGATRAAIETTRLVGSDPDLDGLHMWGGLSNLSAQMPAAKVNGQSMKLLLENAFLTLTVPNGFDTVLGTPWRDYALLSDDHQVLSDFQEIIALDGSDALRRLRKMYTA